MYKNKKYKYYNNNIYLLNIHFFYYIITIQLYDIHYYFFLIFNNNIEDDKEIIKILTT